MIQAATDAQKLDQLSGARPNTGRIGCEECCCHLTTSYLVGVRDHGGRHDRCSGRRHQGKHQSEENEELAHVSLT